jgi:Kef-type K+ transport system membrane component KefB
MNFGTLALVIAAGLIGPMLASAHRFAPPVVVGQIIAGVIIGTGGLQWIDPTDPMLKGLAAIGFAVLMFIVGTHLPVREPGLRAAASAGFGLTATVFVLATVAALSLAQVTGLHRPAILTVLIATSSGAVALPVLQGLGRSDRSVLVATVWIGAADIVTVLSLPVVLATGRPARVILGGALVLLASGVLYIAARQLRHRSWVHRMRGLSRDRGWGLDLRISLLALFACAWLATRFGTSVLIAGFAVGGVVAILGEPRRVAQQLVGIGEGFLVPLFFVHLGTQLELGALFRSPRSIGLAGVIAGVAIVIHVVSAVVWRLPIGFGLVASAQLGVPAAVVSIGLSTRQLSPAQGSAVMAAVLVTLAACAVGGAKLGHRGALTDAVAPVDVASL